MEDLCGALLLIVNFIQNGGMLRIPKLIISGFKNCRSCKLHLYRKNVVYGRGDIPAKILFIGEAPGKDENLLGEPFVGLSGKLLDKILEDSKKRSRVDNIPSFYIVNTVMCRPTNEKHGENRQPSAAEIIACSENIMQIYNAVKPEIIVLIGKIAEKYYSHLKPNISIYHPAFLLRQGGDRSPYYMPTVKIMSNLFTDLQGSSDE